MDEGRSAFRILTGTPAGKRLIWLRIGITGEPL
jgi:hypothetical protein